LAGWDGLGYNAIASLPRAKRSSGRWIARPRRRWAHKSDRIKTPYHGIHLRQSVLGAVCPQNGQCAAVIFNHCDSEVCQVFLDHLTQRVPRDPTKRRYLIVDNASWHKVKRLNWHHFNPKQLPPYPPDLNPIERLSLPQNLFRTSFLRTVLTEKTDVARISVCSVSSC
jgi:hypothetical protein